MDQRKIGGFIAARRRAAGLTQAMLAERLGVSDRAISKWETGRSLPDVSIMPELCALLGIRVDELLSGGPMEPDSAQRSLLCLLERRLYRASEASASLSFEDFQSALLRMAETSELLQRFGSKAEAVDYLMRETGCPFDECERAYDVYAGMMER